MGSVHALISTHSPMKFPLKIQTIGSKIPWAMSKGFLYSAAMGGSAGKHQHSCRAVDGITLLQPRSGQNSQKMARAES